MNRTPDWERDLNDFISKSRQEPFKWGQNDCCLFAANAVLAVTGYDLAEDFRGKYTTGQGALKCLADHGVRDVAELLELFQSSVVQPQFVAFAQRGDLMLYDLGARLGPAVGVCIGQDSAFVGLAGLQFIPTLSCSKSWRV